MPELPRPQARGVVAGVKRLTKAVLPKRLVDWYIKYQNSRHGGPIMEMYPLTREDIEEVVEAAGASILDIRQDNEAGIGWLSFRYVVARTACRV
jgi:hypothetical protein